MTTPAQRVARLGHFIKQWGPDVLPLSSGLATGDDGRVRIKNITRTVILCRLFMSVVSVSHINM